MTEEKSIEERVEDLEKKVDALEKAAVLSEGTLNPKDANEI